MNVKHLRIPNPIFTDKILITVVEGGQKFRHLRRIFEGPKKYVYLMEREANI